MMPSANQMAIDSTSFGSHIVGNPDLNPETSNTYEGGVDFVQNAFDASLTYFYTDFEDKIVSTTLADGSKSWKNMGDATISGFEVELGYDIGAPMHLAWEIRPYFNITYLTQYEDKSTGENLRDISESNFSAGLVVNNGDTISARLNIAYAGSQDITDYQFSTYQTVELASHTVTDLSASWRFFESEQTGAFTLRGEVTNLFDADYAYVQGYPMPGIGGYLGLRWDY